MSASTHPATTRGRLSSVLCFAALAVLAAGCGLAHYQEQMAKEQERADGIDKENNELGEPVQLPPAKKDPPPYFFRPPKPIASSGALHESSVLQLYGVPVGAQSYFQDVAFGVERMKEDDFWSSLLRALPDKKREEAVDVVKETAGRGKLIFKELKSNDGQVFAYVWSSQDKKVHAAVIFRLTRANDPAARRLMDISLGTLTIGADVGRMQRAYQEWKKQAVLAAKRKEAAAQQDR